MREVLSKHHTLTPFSEVPPRIFETERLRLRALTIADLDLIFETYTGDPIATNYMAWPRYARPEDGRPFLDEVEASFSGTPIGTAPFSWLISFKTTGEAIGILTRRSSMKWCIRGRAQRVSLGSAHEGGAGDTSGVKTKKPGLPHQEHRVFAPRG